MPEMVVNPAPTIQASYLIAFDFPSPGAGDAPGSLAAGNPNYNVGTPGQEEFYGPLGNPPKQQGHPSLRESPGPQVFDPQHQDQVLDINRDIRIEHTGRLSGTLVPLLVRPDYHAVIRMFAQSAMSAANIPLGNITIPLSPVSNVKVPNVWCWETVGSEMICTRLLVVNPRTVNLASETVYRLISKWEFYDNSGIFAPSVRLPISGFDEAVGFEVTGL